MLQWATNASKTNVDVIISSKLTTYFSSDRMVKEILPTWQKSKKHSVREFLYVMSRPNAPLGQVDDVCLALLDSYERARYGAQVQQCGPSPSPPPSPSSVDCAAR